ncbi:right-handed parallel beta-helix repeat-containing protein [Rhodococcus sp. IEGM 1379]|uniref:right-handed parallel beta-helix repeat-containing protein n=1 Tax=Rhodococcus sp. IEGM 1379 TaxID=3047086 RepID=UPI0024B6B5A0|nr:right-handed parallel beta-helix repeat-containing protein [Rhodococcus sp. IEGM 1379]MDI9914355.1 right-handed parallel beta-helix repeat-containing protein [Rhodococcus sp. IEGM 1379]
MDPVTLGMAKADAAKKYVRPTTVDLASFLLPGEAMPNDGVANARPLLQRALDAAATQAVTAGPVTIKLPPGKFRITSSVRWFNGYHVGFVGSGRAATKILPTGEAVFGLMDPSFTIGNYLDDLIFADMTIDCTEQVSGANNVGAKGIAMRWMRNGRFERVRCINTWATSFGCDFLQDTTFVECSAIRSGRGVTGGHDSFGAGFGIGVGNFAVESVSFVNCYAEDCWSAGFFVERLLDIPAPKSARGFAMIGCTSIGGYNGLRDAGGDGVITSGCHFLNASNAGVHVDGYSLSGRHGGRNGNVSSSVIRGNGVGVLVGNAATGAYTFDNNEIAANIGAGVSVTGQVGAGWRFDSNRVEGNGAGGIVLDSPLVVRPELSRNTIRNNGTGDGIKIVGDVVEPKIIGNTIQGHRGVGINLPDATKFMTDPFVQSNVVTENSGGGIVNAKATNDATLIAGNRVGASFTTLTNLFTTPSYETSVTQVAALSRFDAPTQVTTVDAKSGGAHARIVVNQAGSATVRIGRVSAALAGSYTLSAWIRTDKAALIRPFTIGFWAANASQRTWHRGGFRATGDWQRIDMTVVLPADGSRLDFNIALDSATVGMVLDVDAVMVTTGTALWPYFDGSSPGAAWSGTANASTSVLTL